MLYDIRKITDGVSEALNTFGVNTKFYIYQSFDIFDFESEKRQVNWKEEEKRDCWWVVETDFTDFEKICILFC